MHFQIFNFQFVWLGFKYPALQFIGYWEFPKNWRDNSVYKGKPIFRAFSFWLFDVRYIYHRELP
jgi:hypothetical protein